MKLLLALTALTLLAACGARPTPDIGQSSQPLHAVEQPRFWRFYSVVQIPPADGLLQQAAHCDDPPLPPAVAAMGLDIESTPLFGVGKQVPAPTVDEVFCQHSAWVTAAQRAEIARHDRIGAALELMPVAVLPQSRASDRGRAAAVARFAMLAGLPTERPLDRQATTVAVIDTAAPGAPGLPGIGAHETHGQDMALLVRQALCPDDSAPADCGVFVETLPALDLIDDDVGPLPAPDGGAYGDPGQVARAIHRTVDDAAFHGRRLVINLSIAWPAGAESRPSSRAVRAAIEQARAHGAIVVAAAGNTDLCAEESGALLPAAWGGEVRGGAPLLVSAAAVDDDGDPVSNAREYGMDMVTARAFGDGVTADPDFFGPGPSAIDGRDGRSWIGSSVAAVVASAAAAGRLARGDDDDAVLRALTRVNDLGPGLPRRDLLRVCSFLDLPCPPIAPLDIHLDDVPPTLPERLPEAHPRAVDWCAADEWSPGSSPTCEVCFGVLRDQKVSLFFTRAVRNVWLRIDDGKRVRYTPLAGELAGKASHAFAVDLPPESKAEVVYQGLMPQWLRAPISLMD